jgi:UDPglucose 6-dehydrogenase
VSRLAVFGAGYAGLVTGACLAKLGHSVAIRDVDPERIDALRAGRTPFFEPGLDELLERNRERLNFTLDAAEALEGTAFVFVCVGTPATYAGDADLSAVWTVLDELDGVDKGTVLVMKSTVPVGTGEKVRAGLDARGLDHVGYVSCPEFLAEGTAIRDFLEPDRIVIGSFDDGDGDGVEALHVGIDAPVVRMDVASAEMVKLAANAFLATRISFINEIANVSELVGADVEKVAYAMGLDERIGTRYLRAGVGYGGSCYPKDTSFLKLLAGNSGYHFHIVNAAMEVNELQMRRPVRKLQKHLGSLRGKSVALLGLAFKPDTDDLREAPSIVLASRLLAEGADVRAWDPVADASGVLKGVTFCESILEAVRDADAAVVVTEWDELRDLARTEVRKAMRKPLIVDGRNLLDPESARAAGFVYEGIGRPTSPFGGLPETEEPPLRAQELQGPPRTSDT